MYVGNDARRNAPDHTSGTSMLSSRQREVLALLAAGHSIQEIATKLHRSVDTIKSHRRAIGAKLGVDDRVQLARAAIEMGLSSLVAVAVDLSNVGGAVAVLDRAGCIMSASPGFAAAVDVALAQLPGSDIGAALGLDADMRGVAGGVSGSQGATIRCILPSGQAQATFLPMPALGQSYVIVCSQTD
jgi:DNA-binding CsgD family transcriptional regulator